MFYLVFTNNIYCSWPVSHSDPYMILDGKVWRKCNNSFGMRVVITPVLNLLVISQNHFIWYCNTIAFDLWVNYFELRLTDLVIFLIHNFIFTATPTFLTQNFYKRSVSFIASTQLLSYFPTFFTKLITYIPGSVLPLRHLLFDRTGISEVIIIHLWLVV